MTVNFYYPKQLVKKRNILIGLILLGLSIIILLGKVLKKFIEFGGTGIFASWKLLYQEDVFKNGNWRKQCPKLYKNYNHHACKNAEKIQKQILEIKLNFKNLKSAQKSILALKKTIKYYE